MVDHDFGGRIADPRPHVLLAHDEGAAAHILFLPGCGISVRGLALHVVVPAARQTRTLRSSASHPELLEPPGAIGYLRYPHAPRAIAYGTQPGQPPASAKRRIGALRGLVNDRRDRTAAIFRCKDDRTAHRIFAASYLDANRPARAA